MLPLPFKDVSQKLPHKYSHMFQGKSLVRWSYLATWKTGKRNFYSDDQSSENRSSGKGRSEAFSDRAISDTILSPSKKHYSLFGLRFLISKMKD